MKGKSNRCGPKVRTQYVVYELPFQSVISFDHSLHDDRSWSTRRPRGKAKMLGTLLCSWFMYILLPAALVLGMRYGKVSGTVCRSLMPGTEFLLNTTVQGWAPGSPGEIRRKPE